VFLDAPLNVEQKGRLEEIDELRPWFLLLERLHGRLIELMATVAITMILACVAIPSAIKMVDIHNHRIAAQMIADIKLAKNAIPLDQAPASNALSTVDAKFAMWQIPNRWDLSQ
jgi:hypothetical protein